jgi:hypothetical protein
MPVSRKSPRTSGAKTAKKKTAKKKKTAGSKRAGDVIGLSGARPPKRPVKSSGKKRRPQGIEITREHRRPRLPPARVRG